MRARVVFQGIRRMVTQRSVRVIASLRLYAIAREAEHLAYVPLAGGQHQHPVQSERDAGRIWEPSLERAQQTVVEGGFMQAGLAAKREIPAETLFLLSGIAEFVKAVTQFHASQVGLEACCEAAVLWQQAGECCL
jgi:hypothetical protein